MLPRRAVALAALTALAIFAGFGCEAPPDASADSGSTCEHVSARNDVQCAGVPEGCSRDCLDGENGTQLAAHGAGSCLESACPSGPKGSAACVEAHAAASDDGTPSEHPCPHTAGPVCERPHGDADGCDAPPMHSGCPHAGGDSQTDPR